MAKLLQVHGYRVVIVGEGRSEDTLARIRAVAIEALPTDQDLVIQVDYILSIVPPRNALDTATRIAGVCRQPETESRRRSLTDINGHASRSPLNFLDLNTRPSRLAEETRALFADPTTATSGTVRCHFLDGGIIGGPPAQQADGTWKRPSVVVSGVVGEGRQAPHTFAPLAAVLKVKIATERIGAAPTLKFSFAALCRSGKRSHGAVDPVLLHGSAGGAAAGTLAHLDEYSPATAALSRSGVVGMSPKAYRWEEMRGIGVTLDREGGWDGVGERVYGVIAEGVSHGGGRDDPRTGTSRAADTRTQCERRCRYYCQVLPMRTSTAKTWS
ncbi:Dehydrogenase multihelical [Penicillium argentinense]|uniref:Dehydrogenase multihelical n=1 Tax=Penicillium argentinense TaxID=1131581 RepID=A0A9W9FN37_9EURO|nr:Dehydrogenase multihelical [Penicillium argentinense]KAJ5103254.1 Dehydrogenase multihelical [Penicillium argentinense]